MLRKMIVMLKQNDNLNKGDIKRKSCLWKWGKKYLLNVVKRSLLSLIFFGLSLTLICFK